MDIVTPPAKDYVVPGMKGLNLQQTVPLTLGSDGVMRVAGSRVTLDSLIHQFQHGATAEQIQEDFPSVSLRDIYAVIAYYLQHTRSVEEYLCEQSQGAVKARQEIEAGQNTGNLRARLRERRAHAIKPG